MTQIKAIMLEKYQLTPRQLDVAVLAHKGFTNAVIGTTIYVCEKTVKYHMSLIFKRCDVKSRFELILLMNKLMDDES